MRWGNRQIGNREITEQTVISAVLKTDVEAWMSGGCKRRAPGRLHHKSFTQQNFFEVAVVPTGGEAFIFDADFECRLIFEQAQCGPAENAEVRVGVALAEAALIFLKRDVELPMQTVLNAPVAAHGRGETMRRQVLVENVVADFVAVLAVPLGVADGDPDGLQVGPPGTVRQVLRNGTDDIVTPLLAAVSLFRRLKAACGRAAKSSSR